MRPIRKLLRVLGIVGCVFITSATVFAQTPKINWDWTGIIGTGQSLSVGQAGKPAASTTQQYNNLQLSTGSLPWPINPDEPSLKMIPLTEPIGRPSTAYPSSWPTNIAGETPHTAMSIQLTSMVKAAFNRDFVTVHGAVGENGQGMQFLKKGAQQRGVNGHAYEATLIETKAITRLAKAAGKTYGISAFIVTHGESDAGNADYENQLHQLLMDYNADLPAITGQTQPIFMIVSQQNSSGNRSASMQAEWKIGVDYPKEMVCSGPKYQYPYAPDALHCTTEGYRQLGEKYAQVYYERVILGKDWQPLYPTKAERKGTTITVQFHVPVAPLAWEKFDLPHQSIDEWKAGKGFEVSTSSGQRVNIQSVEIANDSVVITCGADPGDGARVSYAMFGEPRGVKMTQPFAGTSHWGLLRDSDPFKGVVTGTGQPNYGVAFEMTVP